MTQTSRGWNSVDGYFQWCTLFVWTLQGTGVARRSSQPHSPTTLTRPLVPCLKHPPRLMGRCVHWWLGFLSPPQLSPYGHLPYSQSISVDACGSCGVIEESPPLRGRVRLTVDTRFIEPAWRSYLTFGRLCELELELIQTQMTQKPMLRAEVGMRVRCAN